MNDLYSMVARLSLDVTGFGSAAAMAMSVFQKLHSQAGLATAQVDKLSAAFKTFAAGAAITGVGAVLVDFMSKAVQRAMDLQTIMVGIQQRTGAALIDPRTQQFTAQGTQVQRLFENIGLTNQMSTVDVAGVSQAASRAGITQMSQLTQMLKPLANYSEIMLRATGADTAGSAKIATEFAHLFGAFGNKQIGGVSDTQYLVNQLGKAMQVVPVSQEQFLRLMSQFVGTERPLYRGKPPQKLISDTIDEGVLIAQMGQGSRGGNQIARIITSMMGGARGKTALEAISGIQRGTGIAFANAQGQINDPSLLLKALATTAQKLNPADTLKEFTRAFQQNGARLAGLFSDPVVGARLTVIADAMKAMPDLQAQQRAYNASPAGQFNQARKNFDSAMTTLGVLWLPIATRAANALASFTAGIVRFAQQNPALMKFMALFIALTAAVALIVGPFLMLAGVVGMLAAVGLPALVAAIGPVLLGLGIVATVMAVAALTVTNWSDLLRGTFHAFQQWGVLGQVMDTLFQTLFTTLYTQTVGLIDAFRLLTGGVQWIVAHIPTIGLPPGVQIPGLGTGFDWGTVGRGVARQLLPPWLSPFVPTGGGGYVPPPVAPGRRSGGGVQEHHYHFGAISVAPVVHAAPGHNEEALAQRVATLTLRELGDGLQAAIDHGATTVLGLSPSLHVAR